MGVVPVFSALDENSNFALDWSRDKSESTKVISVLALVGVGAGIKSGFLPFFAHFERLSSQITAKRLDIELKSPSSTPHILAIAYKMAPVKSL